MPGAQNELMQRVALLCAHPLFAQLPPNILDELAQHLILVEFVPEQLIVKKNELVDSVYFIASGQADVFAEENPTSETLALARLRPGEVIGLNETGFFSTSGLRTATVQAVTAVTAYQLSNQILQYMQQHYNIFNYHIQKGLNTIQCVEFIKKLRPFMSYPADQLKTLVSAMDVVDYPAQTQVVKQDVFSTHCYYVLDGELAVTLKNIDHAIALLNPGDIFGEVGLILKQPAGATVTAQTKVKLIQIPQEVFYELYQQDEEIKQYFNRLLRSRSRPIQNPNSTLFKKEDEKNGIIYLLRNNENQEIYELTDEGIEVLKLLDGKKTFNDITQHFNQSWETNSEQSIANFLFELEHIGLVKLIGYKEELEISAEKNPLWIRILVQAPKYLEYFKAWEKSDKYVERINHYCPWLFKPFFQIFLFAILLGGIWTFIQNITPAIAHLPVLRFSSYIAIYIVSFITVSIHELGHGLLLKHFGFKVKSMGIGWFWIGPAAYCDTSDILLSSLRNRILINLVGVYFQAITASILLIAASFTHSIEILSAAWLFAALMYINVFFNFNPIIDTDGYYLIQDLFNNLDIRENAVIWIAKNGFLGFFDLEMWREYRDEISYWLVVLLFLILIIPIAMVFQYYVLGTIFTIFKNPVIKYIFTLTILSFSLLTVWAKLKAAHRITD